MSPPKGPKKPGSDGDDQIGKRTKSSGSLQLGIFLHQLLQPKAWKLYRNLGFFAFSLALIYRAFTILRMPDSLSRAESALARGLSDRSFGQREFLTAAGEKFGNVLDRVVSLGRNCGPTGTSPTPIAMRRTPRRTLILIFIGIMGALGMVRSIPPCGTLSGAHTSACGSELLDQPRRNFFEKSRRHTRLRQIGPVPTPVDHARQDQLIHSPSHAHIAESPLFLDILGHKHGPRMRKQSLFETAQKHQRKLQALGRVQAHERDLGLLIVVISVSDQSGMI